MKYFLEQFSGFSPGRFILKQMETFTQFLNLHCKNIERQVCIPVECVPAVSVAVLEGWGWCLTGEGGVCLGGVCLGGICLDCTPFGPRGRHTLPIACWDTPQPL